MSRLSDANVSVALEIIGRFPRPKSALIPLLHLAQEQDGYVTNDAMAHIAELARHHAGRGVRHGHVLRDVQVRAGRPYCINICTNISCQLIGAWELLEHAEHRSA